MTELNLSRQSPVRAALMAAALVAGCGGGGDRGSGVTPPPAAGQINWGPPAVLAAAAPNLRAPVAAVNGAGLVVVGWAQSGVAGGALASNRYVVLRENSAADAWAARVAVDPSAPTDEADELVDELAADARGGPVTLAWRRLAPGSSDRGVRAATRQAGAAWDLVALPRVPAPGFRSFVVLASGDNGMQALAWTEAAGSVSRIQLRVRRIGSGGFDWFAPTMPVQSDPSASGSQPALAVDPASGRVMIAWRQDGPTGEVRARVFDPSSGSFTPDFAVDPSQPDTSVPSVVALGGGEFYATWLQNSNGALQLRGKRFTGSAWLATSQRIDNRDDWAARVSLVGGPTGTSWVAWEQGGLLFAARYNPATGNWTHPIPVGASLAGVPQALRAAVDGGGNAVLAWVQRDVGTAEDLYYTTVGSTASVAGPPVLLETEAGPVIGALALAVNTTGVAVIAWLQTPANQTQLALIARVARP